MKLWSVLGNSQKLDGGAMFGNAPRNLWAKWLAPDDQNRLEFACRCLLVEGLEGRTVLFETGIGAFFEPRLRERYGVHDSEHVLLRSLAARGVRHEDVDAVVLSHLHFDHAGGLLTAYEEGRAPDVDVAVDPGKVPEVDVRGPDVDVGTEKKEVTVPDVDVDIPSENEEEVDASAEPEN